MIARKKILPTTALALGASLSMSTYAQYDAPSLEETVVVASRVEMPLRQVGASVSVMTEEELEQKNFPALADALRTLPGISVTQAGGLGKATGLRVRGEEAHRTQVLIDGINVSDVTAVQAMPRFGHLLNSQFGRVEVLRGPQGMMYGADAGGVISLYSKQSDEPVAADIGAEYGRYDTRRLNGNLRGTLGGMSYSLTASDLSSDGINAREADNTNDLDGYENTTLHGTLGWALTKNLSLNVVARDTEGVSQFDVCGFPSTNNCEDDFKQRSGKAGLRYEDETQSHELAFLQTTTDNVNRVIEQGYNSLDNEGELEKWQYVGNYQMAEDVGLVFGADHKTSEYRDNTSVNSFRERDQTGAFAEGQVAFDNTIFYTVGLRYDDNEDFGEHLSYRLTGAYLVPAALGEVKFRGSYGTGFRAPSLYEIGYNAGPYAGPNVPQRLTEETSRGYELGAEWLIADNTFVELVWFDSRIEDEIFFDMIGFAGYLQAEGETQSQGIELNGSVKLADGLVLSGNYTYNDTELSEETAFLGAEPGGQRARRPEHLFNASIRYSFWQDRVDLALLYRNSRDAVDYVFGTGRVPLDDYDLVDLTGSWRITESVEAYLRWENALDEDYQQVPGYHTTGSAGYAGVRLSF